MTAKDIVSYLPYSHPFLFVDEILEVDDNKISGVYTYKPSLDFYKGHFKDHPVTPGVILIETMAQIGLVCLGIYLSNEEFNVVEPANENKVTKDNARSFLQSAGSIVLTSSSIDFLKPVYPAEKVNVYAEKVYFRFNKLKCNVRMINEAGEVVCQGTISGMMKGNSNG